MSKAAVLIWLIVALILGAAALWLFRTPPTAPSTTRAPVVSAPMSRVVELSVTPQGGSTQRVFREPTSGDWFLAGEGGDWPVQIANIQGALRLLCTLEGRDAVDTPEPPGPGDAEVRLTLDDGTAWMLWLAPRSLGGERAARIQPPGETARTVLIEGGLFDALLSTGPSAWRVPVAFSDLSTDVTRITLTALNGRIVLGRIAGRWALQEPVSAPADEKAVQTLLRNLSSVRIARFLPASQDSAAARFDAPIATAELVAERRVPAGDGFETVTSTRTLTVGAPASIDGKELYARVERTGSGGGGGGAPSSTTVAISRESVDAVSMDAVSYLPPTAVASPAGEIGMVVISPMHRSFSRSVDGWSADAPPAAPEDNGRVSALLKLLCEEAAESRLLQPLPLAAPVRIQLSSLGGTPLGEVSLGLSDGPVQLDGTPGPQKLMVVSGEVARLFDPAPWRETLDWLLTPTAR